ncbi:MAG: phage major capsid protein [Bacteroidetes bacterium]|nr:phage major capsid protein [Bacteroidota bacterium]
MFTRKNAEEISKMSEVEINDYHTALEKHREEKETELNKSISEKANASDVAELKTLVEGLKVSEFEAMKSTLKAQGAAMAKLVEQVEMSTSKEDISFTTAVLKGLKENSDRLETVLKEGAGTIKLEIKASQSAADITSGTDFATMEGGVGQIATRDALMKSLFPVQAISSEYLKYNDQETIVRDAKNVAGCAASTHNSKITWQVRTLQISKVRDYVDVCVDMMEDFPYIESEIRNLVSTDVALKVDQQLLLGTGVYPELNSVDAVASTFAAGSYALAIQDATLIDLIKVGAAQISDFGQNNKFMANTVLLNPVDAMKMQLLKNADGNYMVPNWITSDGVNIGAMRVIANQLVPVNEAYIFDSSKGTIFQRRGATVELAFENRENFEKELVTVKAYERLNFRVRNVDANAFMHIASISLAVTAITKL